MSLLRFLRAELTEIHLFRLRYAGLLALAAVSVVLAGQLSYEDIPARGIVFTEGMTEEESDQIATYLVNFSNVEFSEVPTRIDPEALRARDAAFGLGKARGQFSAVWNPAASEQVTIQLAQPPNNGAQGAGATPPAGETGDTDSDVATDVRAALLAGVVPISPPTLAGPHVLITKVLVFVSIFAPFLFALESFMRQRQNQVQAVYLSGSRGSLAAYCIAKVMTSVLAGIVVLIAGLVAAGALFELLPTDGALPMLVLYICAATASAAIGLTVAAIVESNRALGAVAGYFLALLLFGGVFLPLSSASPIVQAASYALPLRYPMHHFHMWLLQGQAFDLNNVLAGVPAPGSAFELMMFAALVLASILASVLALAWMRLRN
jgi:ABC-type multidrug transport system permease subunit